DRGAGGGGRDDGGWTRDRGRGVLRLERAGVVLADHAAEARAVVLRVGADGEHDAGVADERRGQLDTAAAAHRLDDVRLDEDDLARVGDAARALVLPALGAGGRAEALPSDAGERVHVGHRAP